MALEHKPDAILVDLMMRSHTGLEVCQALSSLSFTEIIPIFIISGAPKTLYKDFCYTLGARGYFEKPIEFDLLKAQLAAALAENRGDHRAEPRISMRLGVKLRGVDQKGEPFEFLTSTENVSRHGFTCGIERALERKYDRRAVFMDTNVAPVRRTGSTCLARMVRHGAHADGRLPLCRRTPRMDFLNSRNVRFLLPWKAAIQNKFPAHPTSASLVT